MSFWGWLRRRLGYTDVLEEIANLSIRIRALPPALPPPPSMTVLVVGFDRARKGRTLGAQRVVDERLSFVEVVTQTALFDVSVIVFCDVERVRVSAIFCGTDLMTVGLGPCPIAFVDTWEPGVKITVRAEPL